jgi:hypothetical protein
MKPETARYRLDADQVATLVQLCGVEPDGRLIAPASPPAPSSLEGTGLLDASGTRPVPILEAAIEIVARPSRVLSVRVVVPGTAEWDITHVVANAEGGPYVVVAGSEGALDLLVLPSEYELAAVLDGLFDLTTLPTRPVAPDALVSFDGWIGVLAAADVGRSGYLSAQLERHDAPELRFAAADLEHAVASGLPASDTRWAVTAFTPLSLFDLRTAPPSGAAMVAGMTNAGLIEPEGAVLRTTALGDDLVNLCRDAIKWGSATLTFADGDSAVRLGEVSVVRSPLRVGLAFWNGDDVARTVTLVEPEAEVAVEMLRRMLLIPPPTSVPAVQEARCSACGAAIEAEQGFCAKCGSDLGVAVPSPAATCPQCGGGIDLEHDAFCATCGAPVSRPPNRGGGS